MRRRSLVLAGCPGALAAPTVVRAAEAGVTEREVLLGHTGTRSGPLGARIEALLAGAQLAFADRAGRGGVAGRSVRLVRLDDGLKPELAVANCHRLLSKEKVFAFFACVGSATTAAALPVLRNSGTALIGGFAVADSAREKARGTAWFLRATTGREAQAVVKHLSTIGMGRIAVAHADDPDGLEALAALQGALRAYRLEAVASAAIRGDGGNLAEAAGRLAGPGAQAVVMALGGTLAAGLMQRLWALGSRPAFYGLSDVPGEATAQVLGQRASGLAIAQVLPYPWAPIEPTAVAFRRSCAAAGLGVGYDAYEGYLDALLMLEVLSRCGRDLTRARLQQVMHDFKVTLAGIDVDFGKGWHTGSHFVELVRLGQGGRFLR